MALLKGSSHRQNKKAPPLSRTGRAPATFQRGTSETLRITDTSQSRGQSNAGDVTQGDKRWIVPIGVIGQTLTLRINLFIFSFHGKIGQKRRGRSQPLHRQGIYPATSLSQPSQRLQHDNRWFKRRSNYENDADGFRPGHLVLDHDGARLSGHNPHNGEEETFEAASGSLHETVLAMARLGATTAGQGHLVWS